MFNRAEQSSKNRMRDTKTDPRYERTADAIRSAAVLLLVSGGPDAVTHVAVAKSANLSRTTVYSHHPTREDLLRETLERMRPPDNIATSGDLRTDLVTGLSMLAEDLGQEDRVKMFAAILERSQHDPDVATVRRMVIHTAMERFTEVLEGGIASGQLREDLDTDLAMAGLVGTFFFRRFLSDQPVDRSVIEKVVDTFLNLNAPPGE